MSRALLPNAVWRVGMVEATIRKLTVAAMLALLLHVGFPDSAVVNEQFVALQPVLTSCLDDDDTTTRRLACRVLTAILKSLNQVCGGLAAEAGGRTASEIAHLSREQVNDLYPELLKRLDDSSDEIRVMACDMLVAFWSSAPASSFHSTCLAYAFDMLFVHLDDPQRKIQQAIHRALQAAVSLGPSLMVEKAKENRGRHRSPLLCDHLRDYATPLIQRETEDDREGTLNGDVARAGPPASKCQPVQSSMIDTSDLDDIDD